MISHHLQFHEKSAEEELREQVRKEVLAPLN